MDEDGLQSRGPEEVWAQPLGDVAERYGVNSADLVKICERLQVPRPSQGHWARVKAGRADPIPELRPLPEGVSDTHEISEHVEDPLPPEYAARLLTTPPPNPVRPPVTVATELPRRLHPVAEQLRKRLGQVLALSNGWGMKKMSALAATLANVVTVELLSGPIPEAYVEMALASRRHRPSARTSARTMTDNDLWIAATAKVARATLLTTDKDFPHLSPKHCRIVFIDPHTGTPQEISNGQEEEDRSRMGRRHRCDAGLRHGRR